MLDSSDRKSYEKEQQSTNDSLLQLSQGVGDFIHYWGFRKIHGQIWTLVYLSEEPIKPTLLASRLKVSKALISSALGDLEKYDLIRRVKTDNKKEKLYEPNLDVFGVIQNILKDRELPMLDGVLKNANDILASTPSQEDSDDISVRNDRLGHILLWTQMAKAFVGSIATADSVTDIPVDIE